MMKATLVTSFVAVHFFGIFHPLLDRVIPSSMDDCLISAFRLFSNCNNGRLWMPFQSKLEAEVV
ncbi:hypothetical protein IOC57_09550 [Bacillus sp. SD075]|uniref:hypothetical protein n=1 Tax=Bacillus sp. SD075 TaxID=2781732 RepID=UPI001A97A9EB|nr:hypothetical protein [Bacillus sp. SD075]MBO0997992.1 hypothetical protein [Bacillus sp. SD075]